MGKLVYGVGINDADYNVQKYENINGKPVRYWVCPFYVIWTEMLRRCYSDKFQESHPTYKGCLVIPEWQYFMNFKAWMEKQEWENKFLDKDLLVIGNKIYGPDTCVFVSRAINNFLTERTAKRGEFPIGVCIHKGTGRFAAQGFSLETGKRRHLGLFDDAQEAYEVWLKHKLQQAKLLASEQSDPRIAKALIDRYENYKQ